MKQLLQNLKTGITEVVDVPAPAPAVGRGPSLIPFDQIANVTRATFAALKSARMGAVISLQP